MAMFAQPAASRQPAAVRDDTRYVDGLPRRDPLQKCGDGFAAAWRIAVQVRAPGIDLGAGDRCPRLAIPHAEVDLDQGGVDAMHPAPAFQPPPDRGAASQRRGGHDARQLLTTSQAADAVGQPLRATWIDGQVCARADATPFGPLRTRMAPRVDDIGHHVQLVASSAVNASRIASSANCSVAPRVSPV